MKIKRVDGFVKVTSAISDMEKEFNKKFPNCGIDITNVSTPGKCLWWYDYDYNYYWYVGDRTAVKVELHAYERIRRFVFKMDREEVTSMTFKNSDSPTEIVTKLINRLRWLYDRIEVEVVKMKNSKGDDFSCEFNVFDNTSNKTDVFEIKNG